MPQTIAFVSLINKVIFTTLLFCKRVKVEVGFSCELLSCTLSRIFIFYVYPAYISPLLLRVSSNTCFQYRVALRVAKDPRIERLICSHKGTYADDCLVQRVQEHKCYIVATNDKDLRRRIRKIPGVPIMYVQQKRYSIERMPDAFGAPRT